MGGIDIGPRELGELITMKTAECEGVTEVGAHLAEACAARVLTVEPLGSGHNVKALVDAGRHGRRTVVCGAPNCQPGITAAYLPPGTRLSGRVIGSLVIDGVASEGMLASGAELGITRDTEGLLLVDAEPGEPIPGCVPDFIIEIDNKSITHRPDLWGHLGVAREVAAICRGAVHDPVRIDLIPDGPPAIEVEIQDLALCPRYSALCFDGVRVGPSPLWMQYRLESIGLNPINNLVDVTNYIMAELCEPMHAFDRDMLRGEKIIVRTAREGEFIAALNQETYKLDDATLVIADEQGPIAIGGVIGGLDSGIVSGTRRVVLEAANFKAASIRKTSSRLKLRTDASMRFEKAQDPANTVRGLARAVELFSLVSPGIQVAGGLIDAGGAPAQLPQIALQMDWLERKLGRPVEPAQVRQILEALQFGVRDVSPRIFAVTVPSWRATRDVSIKDDLVEEVGRMVGYDTITPEPPLLPSARPIINEERVFHHEVRALVSAQGFTEVYNYSFVSQDAAQAFGLDPLEHVAVLNPIASDQGLLRRSLLPGIWMNVRDNSRHLENFRLFEIGYEIHKQADGLPHEIAHLAAAIHTREGDGQAGLFEAKRLAECLMPGAELTPAEHESYEHPTRCWALSWRGEQLGRIFELHPAFSPGRTAVLDVNLEAVQSLRAEEKRYRPHRRYPSSGFDLSVVTGERELAGTIERRLTQLAGESLESVQFLRQYSGPPLEPGTKSVSFRLIVYAPDHTLSAGEVTAIRDRVIAGMREAGYDLRL